MKLDHLARWFSSNGPSAAPSLRWDANESLAFARQLEYVFTQTYDVKYPELKARLLIPVDTSVDAGAESHTYSTFDEVGEAKLVDDHAMDFPNVELQGTQSTARIVSLGDSYQYSWQDMRRAQMLGMDLDVRKAQAARRVLERKFDQISALGATNVPGFATNSAVPILNAASTPALIGDWNDPATTADQILADIDIARDDLFTKSLGTAMGLDLVLPLAAFAAINSKVVGDFDRRTIAQFLVQTGRLRSIEPWVALGTAGAGGTPRGVLYDKSPENLSLIVPQDFEQTPEQAVGMTFKVLCHMRTGGVVNRYPLAMRYLDGIVG